MARAREMVMGRPSGDGAALGFGRRRRTAFRLKKFNQVRLCDLPALASAGDIRQLDLFFLGDPSCGGR